MDLKIEPKPVNDTNREAVRMQTLKGPNRIIRNVCGVDADKAMGIKDGKGYGVSIAVHDGEGHFITYCAGSGRYGEDFPVNPDMLFQAGSVSKPMFALTLLRYVDKGLINLDADISGIVPEFVREGPLTFPALLSHTAGYNLHGFPGYRADHKPLSLEDVLNGKGNTPKLRRIRPYGGQHMYSGGGITLAELAFTRLTGTTLREAFRKEVAEPLGLQRTGFFQPLDEELAANAAFGSRPAPFSFRLTPSGFMVQKEDPAHRYHYFPEHAAAGLWTTPTELVRIGLALSGSYRRDGFLKKETAQRMMTPVMDGYGLCLNVWESEARKDSVAGHGGWNWGFLTSWVFSRSKDICVAIMYNNATKAANKAMNDIAGEIYKNAKD